MTSRQAYTISAALLLASALILAGRPSQPRFETSRARLTRLPLAAAGWQGWDLRISKRDRQILGNPDFLFRQYQKGGGAVNLFILESASSRTSFHPPEYCFVGAGMEETERGVRKLEYGKGWVTARRNLFVNEGGQQSLVYYWYVIGEHVTTNYYRQQLWMLTDFIRGDARPAWLIRLSVEGRFEVRAGDELIAEFVREVLPQLTPFLDRSRI